MTSFRNGICERCCKHVSQHDGSIHTCTPTRGWSELERSNKELRESLEPLRAKFRSGNDVPVERSVIRACEWAHVEAALSAADAKGEKG